MFFVSLFLSLFPSEEKKNYPAKVGRGWWLLLLRRIVSLNLSKEKATDDLASFRKVARK
jgi:hypothetical protein